MSEQTVAPRKVRIVENLQDLMQSYQTVGIVAMEGIGANTIQKIREELRGRAILKVAKNTLMKKAIDLLEGGLDGASKLEEHIFGPVAFLFTNDSPYQIANFLDKNKVKAPAKAGQVAPSSVLVPAQNTGVPPGTFISELNAVGLATRIEQGTIAIPDDTTVVEAGEKVSATLASILARLGIEPFEVGLSLALVLERGDIVMGDELLIDFDEYRNDLMWVYQQAVNLSVNAGILTKTTATAIIGKTQREALAVATEAGYVSKGSAPAVLGRARALAFALMHAALSVDESAVPPEIASQAATVAPAAGTSTPTETPEEKVVEEEEEEDGEEVDDDLGSLF